MGGEQGFMRWRLNRTAIVTVALLAVLVPLGLAPSVIAEPQFTLGGEVFASDAQVNGYFGRAIDIDGDTMIVGSDRATIDGEAFAGAAYIFVKSGSRWVQTAKLVAPDADAGDRFGCDVAIDGDWVVVGAWGDSETGVENGAAYVYYLSSGQWRFDRKILPSDPDDEDEFGTRVDINGTTVVVGAPWRGNGAAYVFTGQHSWIQQQKLSTGVAAGRFGSDVSLQGDTLLVGSRNDASRGAAYVFTRSAGVWTQQAQLTATSNVGDQFGTSVGLSGGTIVIGAPYNDDLAGRVNAGAAYVFTGSGATWTQQTRLLPPQSLADGDYFGKSVDIDGGRIVVGAPYSDINQVDAGGLWAFDGSGASWTPYPIAQDPDWTKAGQNGGSSVAVSGDRMISGAPSDSERAANAGSAHVFDLEADSSPFTYWDNGVKITFSALTVPGEFTATDRFQSVNTTPTGFVLTDRALFDLSTTVSYTGTFTVTIPYSADNVPNWLNVDGPVDEADLKLLHFDGGSWVDITTSVDTVANTVSGTASSFSEFGVAESGTATSSPYFAWDPAGGNTGALSTPHKDYRITTTKCGVCHAVHNAKPDGELLLPTTRANACIYCHITTSVGSIVVYGGDPDNYLIEDDFGHQAEGGATCTGCHAVHGANTIGGDQGLETKILHAGGYQSELVTMLAAGDEDAITNGTPPPDWGGDWGAQDWSEWDVQYTAFCTRCHQNYAHTSTQTVAATGFRTHPMRDYYDPNWPDPDVPDIIGLGIQYADYSTRGCSWWCHYAPRSNGSPGVNVQSLPHHNPGYDKFLIAAGSTDNPSNDVPAADSDTDDVCLYCHIWRSPDEGVGRTY